MDGLDRSGDIFKILESRIVAKMAWYRQDFFNLCTILLAGSHIMKGSALRFLRYPLTDLFGILPGKYANEFVTQDTRGPGFLQATPPLVLQGAVFFRFQFFERSQARKWDVTI